MSEFSAELVLEAQGLVREFREGQGSLRVLDELELKLARG